MQRITLTLMGLLLWTSCQSMEEGGCLTCHQYPGLVTLQANNHIKLLHIDETSYQKSPHGTLACRACHIGVDKIPHAGANKTTCGSNCHTGKEGKQVIAKGLARKIHRGQQSAIQQLNDGTSCQVCHSIYPHSNEVFVRAMLNMHTGYIVCEVCHLDKKQYSSLQYDWIKTEKVKYQGRSFASFYSPSQDKTTRTSIPLYRIAPFAMVNGKKTELMNRRDTARALEMHREQPRQTLTKGTTSFKTFHRGISKGDTVVSCEACHAEKGLLDFERLGFSRQRATALININVKGIVSKYQDFYLPQMFTQ